MIYSNPREYGVKDYTRGIEEKRLAFVREQTKVPIEHLGHYSFDPDILPGNIELFSGAAQLPDLLVHMQEHGNVDMLNFIH